VLSLTLLRLLSVATLLLLRRLAISASTSLRLLLLLWLRSTSAVWSTSASTLSLCCC
jgi:hypothetical protein